MCQWIGPALVQIMASWLFGTKPLPEPMLAYFQLESWKQISMKFESELYHFLSRKFIWKCRLPKWWPFCPGGDELISSTERTWTVMRKLQLTTSDAIPPIHWKTLIIWEWIQNQHHNSWYITQNIAQKYWDVFSKTNFLLHHYNQIYH